MKEIEKFDNSSDRDERISMIFYKLLEIEAKIDELKPKRKAPKQEKPAVGIASYIQHCKETGEDQIPKSCKVFEYAEEAKIPMKFLRLAWLEFVEQMKDKGKRQKDWPRTFQVYIRNNYLKLWYYEGGECKLNSVGQQAETKHRSRLNG